MSVSALCVCVRRRDVAGGCEHDDLEQEERMAPSCFHILSPFVCVYDLMNVNEYRGIYRETVFVIVCGGSTGAVKTRPYNLSRCYKYETLGFGGQLVLD